MRCVSAIKLINGENAMKSSKSYVGIYVDLQNVLSIKKYGNLLLDFAQLKGDLILKKAYYNSQCQHQIPIMKKLESLGVDCVDVPCPLKNSADNQLKSDLIDATEGNRTPEIFILVSGDGDFANSVRLLQNLDKKVIVFAQRGNVKQKLIELANEFHFADELPTLINQKNKHQSHTLSSEINLDSAIKSLALA